MDPILDEEDLGIFNVKRLALKQWGKWCRESHGHGIAGFVPTTPSLPPTPPGLFVDDTPPPTPPPQTEAPSPPRTPSPPTKDRGMRERRASPTKRSAARARSETLANESTDGVPVYAISSPESPPTPDGDRTKPPPPVPVPASARRSPKPPARAIDAIPAVVQIPASGGSSVSRPPKTPLRTRPAIEPISPTISSPSSLSSSPVSPAASPAACVRSKTPSSARHPPPPLRLPRPAAISAPTQHSAESISAHMAPSDSPSSSSASRRFVNKKKKAVYGNL